MDENKLHTMIYECHGEIKALMTLSSFCGGMELDGDELYFLLRPIEEQLGRIKQRLEPNPL